MALSSFHPAIQSWFQTAFGEPTAPQRQGWPAIASHQHTLIAAPTGSGKTLAAFLASIDQLVRKSLDGQLDDRMHVLYVSPLKALSNDVHRNLQIPLEGIEKVLGKPTGVRTAVRTGDTPRRERTAMVERPPHIFVTTPESLYILLTTRRGREALSTVKTVIVDEIHAMVDDKRGSHLALTLERLEELVEGPLTRVGLSATQKPIEDVARYLVGARDDECTIVDVGHEREIDLAIQVPGSPLSAVMAAEVWEEVYHQLAALITEHDTTLIFVNTRRMAERLARDLGSRLGKQRLSSHHGSLSRKQRLAAEQALKAGELSALIATASLELGIDIGSVDLVCQIGSTRRIATLLQRVGRSGHTVHGTPRGRMFPTTRDELIECIALLDCVRRGELDKLQIPEAPLDILAQQIVAALVTDDYGETELYEMMKAAWPYRDLTRETFDTVVDMLVEGFTTRRGRRGAYIHRDAVHQRLRARKRARLPAIMSGGAIPDLADYDVVIDATEQRVGSVNEDFAVESLPGDVFQLGNTSWRIVRVETGKVRVADAMGQPPSLPFWLGEAPGRSQELSAAVSRIRADVAEQCEEQGRDAAVHWLGSELGVDQGAAVQAVNYLDAARRALGVMPTRNNIVVERFFDESGGMQVVVHSPFGSRLNRAWGLSLRKRFCQSFNFELQAAATEDAIVLSLNETHSFDLQQVFQFLSSKTVRSVLIQALLDAPMFLTRWRWNATRALAVLRFRGGKRVPPQLQRMGAEDLISVVFPDQLACLENIQGEREIPNHPLVSQTIEDCLHEAMDIGAFEGLLRSIEAGERNCVARDVTEPSPLAAEILNARPYAFLDDAPLEERRTQAVYGRRWMDPDQVDELARLDQAAIARVREEIWPDVESADELHDVLCISGYLTLEELEARPGQDWSGHLSTLIESGRACRYRLESRTLWVSAERLPELRLCCPEGIEEPALEVPETVWARLERADGTDPDNALSSLLRARLELLGPVVPARFQAELQQPSAKLEAAFARLEAEGFALHGQYDEDLSGDQWCERRLLARIHRYTLRRLRKEIRPVSKADFMRFLFHWQRVEGDKQVQSSEGLLDLVHQLQGFEVAAGAWETDVLPARVNNYDPGWLDDLCRSGRMVWARWATGQQDGARNAPIRSTPIVFLERTRLQEWHCLAPLPKAGEVDLTRPAMRVLEFLEDRGASFFDDLQRGCRLMPETLENAVGELVSNGLIVADGFAGLRTLLLPSDKKRGRGKRRLESALQNAGRWSRLLRQEDSDDEIEAQLQAAEYFADVILARYGVVFRRLLTRESLAPPWRVLLRVLRRKESRGEVRGGRFVEGFSGEQFALPDAIPLLRRLRREGGDGGLVAVSAADPLNLVGIVSSHQRVPSVASHRILYRNGVPIATRIAGETRYLETLDQDEQWAANTALVRREVPVAMRPWL